VPTPGLLLEEPDAVAESQTRWQTTTTRSATLVQDVTTAACMWACDVDVYRSRVPGQSEFQEGGSCCKLLDTGNSKGSTERPWASIPQILMPR
jgi:hypothetical protein